jgi:hypothetical protein
MGTIENAGRRGSDARLGLAESYALIRGVQQRRGRAHTIADPACLRSLRPLVQRRRRPRKPPSALATQVSNHPRAARIGCLHGCGVALLVSNPAGNSSRDGGYGPDAPLQGWVIFMAGLCLLLAAVSITMVVRGLKRRTSRPPTHRPRREGGHLAGYPRTEPNAESTTDG